MNHLSTNASRRQFLAAATAGAVTATRVPLVAETAARPPAQIAITLDLEMSRHYPRRGMLEWDYQKGNLDEPTKAYSVRAAEIAAELGGTIHFFCVGRVLEQPDISWLQTIAAAGHPIGNHTYDHINVHAKTADQLQFRFRRAPWLTRGRTVPELIEENIRLTQIGLDQRAGIRQRGFRTPGGFVNGLTDRPDLQRQLQDLGFEWVSSKYPRHQYGRPKERPGDDVYASIVAAQAEAQPFAYPTGLIEIPMSPISDVGAFRSTFWKLDWFLRAIDMAVDWAIETGGVFDFLAHPSCLVVEDPEFEAVRLICSKVKQAGPRAKLVNLDEIAARVGSSR